VPVELSPVPVELSLGGENGHVPLLCCWKSSRDSGPVFRFRFIARRYQTANADWNTLKYGGQVDSGFQNLKGFTTRNSLKQKAANAATTYRPMGFREIALTVKVPGPAQLLTRF
jgi:hypothetical protein